VIRAIEASPNGLTVTEIAMVDGGQGTAWKGSPSKAYSNNWDRLFCYEEPKPRDCLILFMGLLPIEWVKKKTMTRSPRPRVASRPGLDSIGGKSSGFRRGA